jgi:ribosomal RNA-processing protein 17
MNSSSTKPKGNRRDDPKKKGGKQKDDPKKKGGKRGNRKEFIKKGKKEIVFDPEARKDYLRGFSDRKKERRAFGLAMQKVKDRTAKLAQRKEEKQDLLKQIEQAEKQKEELMEEVIRSREPRKKEADATHDDGDSDDNSKDSEGDQKASKTIATMFYNDKQTETQWGGQVVVTTSVVPLDGDSDDEDMDAERTKPRGEKKTFDSQQRYAGNVERYMGELKGKMPSKKKSSTQNTKRKGKNGAAEMKGMGGGANLKLAQKALQSTTQVKSKAPAWQKGKGKKGRK